ncbi:16S rRNA (guanine1516-N2)-methyltransferase [Pasteurella testudinis DSM 23072]|uniref:Ribosomal RNA small subunit methyltransferase J n=1 Tax=Pasteurella testudinis DSM 23072 TaxID=1122938 RepID=A0A1W1UBT8_9PAST|nr:class I SAM-dependent methyltransferase [Pasteurella testudinis]SMB78513.1 16S rRNA (guanine1516-N2)-methyltransferase [Pasteurella testudinis DSM 23072]SUB52578.1 metallothionein SmtA [Pasteurella testudinis]
MTVQLLCEDQTQQAQFDRTCAELHLQHDPNAILALVQTAERLELRKLDEPKLGAITVDFVSGAMAHRRKFGGGRGEAVAKAVGIKSGYLPNVIDATAGLGRDAFVLAAIGCKVRLIERHAVVFALLQDGLRRGYQDVEIGGWLQQRMRLLPINSLTALSPAADSADVVYLDPMYPHKQKSALVKKEMRIFQHLVGADLDSDQLLAPAMQLARKRVVVKRPDYAPFLAEQKPHFSQQTKNHRFDIYMGLAENRN